MQALTETRAPCDGVDMEPYSPDALQREREAVDLIATYCAQCPVTLVAACRSMRDGAPGVWGGRYYPKPR